MEYLSASEWYFWHGVDVAYYSKGTKDFELLIPAFKMSNQVTGECLEAFKWGYFLGVVLADQDYLELTTNQEEVIIEFEDQFEDVNIKIKDENDFETSTNITGNC